MTQHARALQMAAHKLELAMKNDDERDEFHVGAVRCERRRGSEFQGYDRRQTSTTKFGWILTHEPTGRTRELPPDRNYGVPKQMASRYAEQFARECEKAGCAAS